MPIYKTKLFHCHRMDPNKGFSPGEIWASTNHFAKESLKLRSTQTSLFLYRNDVRYLEMSNGSERYIAVGIDITYEWVKSTLYQEAGILITSGDTFSRIAPEDVVKLLNKSPGNDVWNEYKYEFRIPYYSASKKDGYAEYVTTLSLRSIPSAKQLAEIIKETDNSPVALKAISTLLEHCKDQIQWPERVQTPKNRYNQVGWGELPAGYGREFNIPGVTVPVSILVKLPDPPTPSVSEDDIKYMIRQNTPVRQLTKAERLRRQMRDALSEKGAEEAYDELMEIGAANGEDHHYMAENYYNQDSYNSGGCAITSLFGKYR